MNTAPQASLSYKKGFSIVELLIVIGIIAVITGVILASVKASKNKAADAEIKSTLSNLAVQIESQEDSQAGVLLDYNVAVERAGVAPTIEALAAKYRILAGFYEYAVISSDKTTGAGGYSGYAIVFPLSTGKYYCVDSAGKGTGRETTGVFYMYAANGTKDCEHATRNPLQLEPLREDELEVL